METVVKEITVEENGQKALIMLKQSLWENSSYYIYIYLWEKKSNNWTPVPLVVFDVDGDIEDIEEVAFMTLKALVNIVNRFYQYGYQNAIDEIITKVSSVIPKV